MDRPQFWRMCHSECSSWLFLVGRHFLFLWPDSPAFLLGSFQSRSCEQEVISQRNWETLPSNLSVEYLSHFSEGILELTLAFWQNNNLNPPLLSHSTAEVKCEFCSRKSISTSNRWPQVWISYLLLFLSWGWNELKSKLRKYAVAKNKAHLFR